MTEGDRFYEVPTGQCRRSAPAALRNRDAIAHVLKNWLPPSGLVLEIASGTGEHVVRFAELFPNLDWQPSDVHQDALGSIAALRDQANLPNVRVPILLDPSDPAWPIDRTAAVLGINMVHISPWASALGLIDGAARVLPRGGPLILYGPWIAADVETAASNLAFDEQLRARNPAWGLRSVEAFAAAAEKRDLILEQTRAMPANNRMLLLRRH